MPDPDLLIRTGGEQRISNFLLWQAAYAELYFGETPPPSVLEVEGAKDITVEFTSMSKTFSMAGWRMGFAVGNPTLIAALTGLETMAGRAALSGVVSPGM